jgi:hypothetical protein
MERQQDVLHEIFNILASEEGSTVRHDPPNSRCNGVQELAIRGRIALLGRLHQTA